MLVIRMFLLKIERHFAYYDLAGLYLPPTGLEDLESKEK